MKRFLLTAASLIVLACFVGFAGMTEEDRGAIF